MDPRLRLLGLFIFFLLIPPIGYGIVSSKTAALDSVSFSQIYWKNGHYYFNLTLKIDNPSLLPLDLGVNVMHLTVNNVSIDITNLTLSKNAIPSRNKTLVTLLINGVPMGQASENGYTPVKVGADVCIELSTEPSFLGFPKGIYCSHAESSSVIEIGS
ncbi:MAG: hypothetical protein F7B60_01765 [Desulfurococcales archaeon]|nr:hypothetical protein [Desulfurococcales archaeon]